jgi:hypothetical protein
MARHDQNTFNRQNLRRIHWNVPNIAWSMDPCEYKQPDTTSSKVYLNQMQDLASRYKFIPMTGEVPLRRRNIRLSRGNLQSFRSAPVPQAGQWQQPESYGG